MKQPSLEQTLNQLRRRKVGMIFWEAFWNFATAFASLVGVFLGMLFILEKKAWTRTENFWLPEMLAICLFLWAFFYALFVVVVRFPSLFQIAADIDAREKLTDLFTTAYSFVQKKDRPLSADLAIEKAQKIILLPSMLYPLCFQRARIWLFIFLILILSLWSFGFSPLAGKNQPKNNPPLVAQNPKTIHPKEKKQPPQNTPQKDLDPRREAKKSPEKKPQTKKNAPSGTAPKEHYIPETMQSLFAEGPKWLRLGSKRIPNPDAQNLSDGQASIPQRRRFFAPQSTQQLHAANLPPEHRKAIERYFSLLRPE